MEQHPVPQNVTTFQFRLIGDMTLKQFTYLGSGLTIAYVIFLVIFPLSSLIALPLIALSSGLGAAFAFMPVADRPLDLWLLSYIHAISAPTQRVWKLEGGGKVDPESVIFKNRLQNYLSSIQPPLPQPVIPAPVAVLPQTPTPTSSKLPLTRIQTAQTPTAPITQPTEAARLEQYKKEIADLTAKLENLTKEAASKIPASTPPPSPIPQPPISIPPTPKPPSKVQLTSSPNVINGIVMDSLGNYLEGVIAIIHNEQGIPVRALKTNKLGQFTGATPLPDGTYNITLEKDNLDFGGISVKLTGHVLEAIEVRAKRGGANEYHPAALAN